MFANQTGNQVGGSLVGGDQINNVTNNYGLRPVTPLTRLYQRFRQDRETNELPPEMYEKLQHFCNRGTDGDIRGLEDKLTASERQDLISMAQRLKEQASKIIMRWQTSGTAQDILAWILGKMYTAFTLNVKPAIQGAAPRTVVDQLIDQRVIQPLEEILGDNDLMLSSDDLLGLLFFLTGNCHIRWDKC